MLDRDQATDDERDEQEQHEVQQLPRIGDDDREARIGEQEVIDEECRDGRQDGWDRARESTGRHDRDEIDGRRIVDANEFAFEQRDGSGRQGERADDGHGRDRAVRARVADPCRRS